MGRTIDSVYSECIRRVLSSGGVTEPIDLANGGFAADEDKLFASRVIYQTEHKVGVEFVSLPRRASRPKRNSGVHSDAVNAIARNY